MTAAPLIAALFFIEKDTAPLAGITPMTVALILLGLGSLGFVIRVLQHLADRRAPSPMPPETP